MMPKKFSAGLFAWMVSGIPEYELNVRGIEPYHIAGFELDRLVLGFVIAGLKVLRSLDVFNEASWISFRHWAKSWAAVAAWGGKDDGWVSVRNRG